MTSTGTWNRDYHIPDPRGVSPSPLFSKFSFFDGLFLRRPVVGTSKDAPMNPFNLPDGLEPHVTRYVKFIQSRPKRTFKLKSGLARHHILPV